MVTTQERTARSGPIRCAVLGSRTNTDAIVASRKQMLAELGCLPSLLEADIALLSLRSSSERRTASSKNPAPIQPKSNSLTVLAEPAISSERLQIGLSAFDLPKHTTIEK